MRTTLDLDDEALEAAMKVSKGRTKSDVVNEALRRFARAERQRQLLDLRASKTRMRVLVDTSPWV